MSALLYVDDHLINSSKFHDYLYKNLPELNNSGINLFSTVGNKTIVNVKDLSTHRTVHGRKIQRVSRGLINNTNQDDVCSYTKENTYVGSIVIPSRITPKHYNFDDYQLKYYVNDVKAHTCISKCLTPFKIGTRFVTYQFNKTLKFFTTRSSTRSSFCNTYLHLTNKYFYV